MLIYLTALFSKSSNCKRLNFDYKLRKVLKNKNGVAVLKGLDYPQQIIDEARNISLELREKYDL